jgi:hypothetical protein
MLLAGFVEFAAIRVARWSHFSHFSHFPRFVYVAGLVGIVVVAGVVSWLGTAIPLILRGNTSAWKALKRSVELSDGYEGALLLLVVETLAGSYLAIYATFYGLSFLFPDPLRNAFWYGWVVMALAIIAGAAFEAPLFIGFSLLADPQLLNTSSLPGSEQPSHIH